MHFGRSVSIAAGMMMVAVGCGDSSSTGESTDTEGGGTAPPVAIAAAPDPETEADAYASAVFSAGASVTNEWLPLTPGMRFVLEGTTVDDDEILEHTVITTVTDLVKVIDGVPTAVLWDQDFSGGQLVEAELAFFAQDDNGAVWRLGEYPEEYEDGEFIEAPAWLAGLEAAVAGIAMPADPSTWARTYSQGWGPVVGFIDRASVHQRFASACVRAGCFDDVVLIDEFNIEEPGSFQVKYFANGVGNIRVDWRGFDDSQEELEVVEIAMLDAAQMAEVREAALALEASAYERSALYAQTLPLQ